MVYGKPGQGKTFFATFLASLHKRVYSNYPITLRGRRVGSYLKKVSDLERIPFSEIKGCVTLDELGKNANARRSSSDNNLAFADLGMLGRKKNVNVVGIAQLSRMADVYFRELAEVSFEMRSWRKTKDELMFEFDVYRGEYLV